MKPTRDLQRDRGEKNSWTPAEAAEWANIPLRTLYRLLREGTAPALPMGQPQTQQLANARSGKRKRACFRYVIPRVAFIRWWESIGKPGPGDTGTAA